MALHESTFSPDKYCTCGWISKKCKQALRQPIATNQCARTIDMPISGAFHLQMHSAELTHILRIFI